MVKRQEVNSRRIQTTTDAIERRGCEAKKETEEKEREEEYECSAAIESPRENGEALEVRTRVSVSLMKF